MSNPPRELGVVCSPEQWELSQEAGRLQSHATRDDYPKIHCLTRGQSIGLTLTTLAALVSLVAVLFIFLVILTRLIKRWMGRLQSRRKLLHGPADIYMLSLLVADLVQAVGTILDIRWINKGVVEVGGFCTAQGVVQQMGEMPVATTTLVIAVHTFITIWWRKGKHSRWVAFAVVAAIWIYPAIFIVAGMSQRGSYITPTPYWCWIGPQWLAMRIAGEYIFLWLALFVSLLLYPLLALWKAGYVENSPRSWWKVTFHSDGRSKIGADQFHANTPNLAKKMLAYPIAYALMVLPLTIVRWITFSSGIHVASAWTFLIITLYGFSGAANVVLLWLTKPQLLLLHEGPPSADGARAGAGPLPSDQSAKSGIHPADGAALPRREFVPPLPADDSSDESSIVERAPHVRHASGGGSRPGGYLDVDVEESYGLQRVSHEGRPSTTGSSNHHRPPPGAYAGNYV